jgi:hypothetical protein
MGANYMEDILARLRAGEGIEDIASQITKDINAANDTYIQEQEKAKAAAEQHEKKVHAMNRILDGLYDILCLYNLDQDVQHALAGCYAEDIINELDAEIDTIQKEVSILGAILRTGADKPAPAPKAQKDPLEDFLNKFVR